MQTKRAALYDWLIIACALINATLFATRCWHAFHADASADKSYEYTYVGDDYPEHLPLPTPTFSTSRMYDLAPTSFPISGPSAAEEWASIYPPGYGFVRLGDQSRLLCVALFHQLHCIEKMRIFFDDPEGAGRAVSWPHQQHCMNYLRQAVLCRADRTLEPFSPDFASTFKSHLVERSDGLKDFTSEFVRAMEMESGEGIARQCGNSDALFDFSGQNYVQWKRDWNISSPWDADKKGHSEGHSHGLRSGIV